MDSPCARNPLLGESLDGAVLAGSERALVVPAEALTCGVEATACPAEVSDWLAADRSPVGATIEGPSAPESGRVGEGPSVSEAEVAD
jgi:hypothetical protein